MRAGQFQVFRLELLALLQDAVTDRARAVLDREDPGKEVRLDLHLVARAHADEVGRDPAAIEGAPRRDDLAHRRDQVRRHCDRAGRHPVEIPLRQVVRESRRVVHVPVREQDVVDRDELVGRLADVEADVELRHAHHRLLPGDGVAEDIQVINLHACQVMTGHLDLPFSIYDLPFILRTRRPLCSAPVPIIIRKS